MVLPWFWRLFAQSSWAAQCDPSSNLPSAVAPACDGLELNICRTLGKHGTLTISYPIARLETFGNFFFPVSKPSQSLMTGVLPGETLSSWSIQGICVLEEWMGSKQIYINQTSQVESLQVWGGPLAGNCCRLTSCPSDMRQIHSSTLTWTPPYGSGFSGRLRSQASNINAALASGEELREV